MPAAAPFVPLITSGLGLGMNYLGNKQREQEMAPMNQANTEAAMAQAQAVKVNEARKRELWNMFQGGFENAGSAWQPGMEGSEGPKSQDAYANLVRAAMARGQMGLVQPTGTGISQQLGSQNFLEAQQAGQDISGAAEAFAESILAKYGQGQTPGAEQPLADTLSISDLGGANVSSGEGFGIPTSGNF